MIAIARYLALFGVALAALTAHADQAERDRSWQESPFGERAVYELETQFSYLSTWGLTDLHDRTSTTGSGSVSLVEGFLEVQSGTTADATADLETVDRVIYEAGRQLEAAIKIGVKDAPTNGATAEWGVGTDRNGAYFRLDDGTLYAVYDARGSEQVAVPRSRMRGDGGDCTSFDAVDDAAVYTIRFNWYGAGGASYWAYYNDAGDIDTLQPCLLHWHAPSVAWDNPNLPIFARVDAGANGDDVNITVGGRRAGSQGKQAIRFRSTGDFRVSQSVAAADGLVPLICIRRESDFPTANDLNAVPINFVGFGVNTTNDALIYLVVDPDLTGASFGTPTFAVDGETAVESDTSATALSNPKQISAPFLIGGGQGNQVGPSRISPDLIKIPFIGEEPTCLAANVASDSTITSTVRVNEGW